ncbi:hypothetical protein [Allosalinactinospora lopnorensis]|uniref:hypothetical protein n=1 Tax=Allosalinactinospora lopnorensis TaxID=1352348 RepID=UPI000623F0C1|nr:hypothetical protein [Allosalinactinospora lopnorensis]
MRKRAAFAVSIASAVSATLGAAPSPEESPENEVPEGSEVAFHLEDPRITESSGMAASELHDDVYWTHNDSGDFLPEIYAVNGDGETKATVSLSGPGMEARDWEAVSPGVDDNGDPAVYVGDIGDNFQGAWPDIRVYRLTEPAEPVDQTIEVETFTFRYEDGGRDAEGMMIDPRDQRLYIVSKEVAGGVYAAPETLDPKGPNELTRIDSAPLYATDAAFASDGSYYAIRTYWAVTFYDASDGVPGSSVAHIKLPETEQGESLTFGPDGTSLLVGSEGERSPVWEIPVPEELTVDEPAGEDDDPAAAPSEKSETGGASGLIWVGAAVAALLIGGIVLLVRKS